MQNITFDQACEVIEQADYMQKPLDGIDKTIHFGVDKHGREFILILQAVSSECSKIGFF
jgi:hypothetical protein